MLALFVLSACSNVPRALELLTVPTKIDLPQRPNLPNPAPIEQLKIDWKVLTAERVPENDSWVMIALSMRDYEELSRNFADTARFIQETMHRLSYYRGELDGPRD